MLFTSLLGMMLSMHTPCHATGAPSSLNAALVCAVLSAYVCCSSSGHAGRNLADRSPSWAPAGLAAFDKVLMTRTTLVFN